MRKSGEEKELAILLLTIDKTLLETYLWGWYNGYVSVSRKKPSARLLKKVGKRFWNKLVRK